MKIRDILGDFINWLEFYFDKHLIFSIHKTGVLQQILIKPQYLNKNDIVIFIKLWFTHDRILHQLEDVNYGKRSGLRMIKALHYHLEEVVKLECCRQLSSFQIAQIFSLSSCYLIKQKEWKIMWRKIYSTTFDTNKLKQYDKLLVSLPAFSPNLKTIKVKFEWCTVAEWHFMIIWTK